MKRREMYSSACHFVAINIPWIVRGSRIIYAVNRVDMSSALIARKINLDRSYPLKGFQRWSRGKYAVWTFDEFREEGLNYPSRRRARGNLNFTTLTAGAVSRWRIDGSRERERRTRQKDRGRERGSEKWIKFESLELEPVTHVSRVNHSDLCAGIAWNKRRW